jgi:hypothetical protein
LCASSQGRLPIFGHPVIDKSVEHKLKKAALEINNKLTGRFKKCGDAG